MFNTRRGAGREPIVQAVSGTSAHADTIDLGARSPSGQLARGIGKHGLSHGSGASAPELHTRAFILVLLFDFVYVIMVSSTTREIFLGRRGREPRSRGRAGPYPPQPPAVPLPHVDW